MPLQWGRMTLSSCRKDQRLRRDGLSRSFRCRCRGRTAIASSNRQDESSQLVEIEMSIQSLTGLCPSPSRLPRARGGPRPRTRRGRRFHPAREPIRGAGGRWRSLSSPFMTLLDVSIVNVALPSMERGLGASAGTVRWVVSGYALTLGLSLLPARRDPAVAASREPRRSRNSSVCTRRPGS